MVKDKYYNGRNENLAKCDVGFKNAEDKSNVVSIELF